MKKKQLSIFSAWGKKTDKNPSTFISGDKPVNLSDDKTDPDCEKCFFTVEACTWEEAMAIYYLRQGWSPYQPSGAAKPCPNCGALYYPLGSGECWQCGCKC